MKHNLSEIMTKANKLSKVYGLSKFESLSKAWALAKLTKRAERKLLPDTKERWTREDTR